MLSKTIRLSAIFCCAFLLLPNSSCNHDGGFIENSTPPEKANVLPSAKDASGIASDVGVFAKSTQSRADAIDEHAKNIEKATPATNQAEIEPSILGIRNETKGLRNDSMAAFTTQLKLMDLSKKLTDQQTKIDLYESFTKKTAADKLTLEKDLQVAKDEIKDLKSSNAKLLKTLLAWVSVICVVGIGASILIGFVLKTPSAFLIAAGCAATLGVSVAVTFYMQQIALVAIGCLGAGLLGAVIYVVVQIHNKNKIAVDLVNTSEIAKQNLPTSSRQKVFGNGAEPGLVEHVQSDVTKRFVAATRSVAKRKHGFSLASSVPTENDTPE